MSFSRRRFLRGSGVALALPALDIFAPRTARAGDERPMSMVYYYTPNGCIPADWFPTTTGSDFVLPPALEPLASVRDHILVTSGLANFPATNQESSGGAHFRGTSGFLTCTHVEKDFTFNNISADQLMANAIGGASVFRSLELGPGGTSTSGICGDTEYPCSYVTSISWADPQTPIPRETSPLDAFERLFSDGSAGSSAEAAKRRLYKRSVLDTVLDQAHTLDGKLGTADRQKLEQYTTAVRELERRLDYLGGLECPVDEDDAPNSSTYLEHLDAFHDIMVLALQCGLTRVISFQTYSGGASDNNLGNYDWVVGPDGQPLDQPFHAFSHHGEDPDNMAKVTAINQWEMELFARFIGKLEAAGVLDSTLVHFGKEYGDPNTHDPMQMPIVLAGGANGLLTPGRHVAWADETPLANLLMWELQAMGVDVASFGDDGTEALTGLG